jgi:glutamate--cysteine ligase catalytic subunit
MECSITDFENAAFVTFIVLLTRVITSFDINMYIPISKVDENMHRAHARDAVLTQKFFFRKVITTGMCFCPLLRARLHVTDCTHYFVSLASSASLAGGCHKYRGENGAATTLPPVEDEYEEMTINQIMNGGNGFTGLIPLMNTYLDAVDMDIETRVLIQRYMTLVSERASGKLQTTAAWIRNFVRSHPTYQHDSVVTQEIAYDLVKKSRDIAEGKFQVPELLGNLWPLQNSN